MLIWTSAEVISDWSSGSCTFYFNFDWYSSPWAPWVPVIRRKLRHGNSIFFPSSEPTWFGCGVSGICPRILSAVRWGELLPSQSSSRLWHYRYPGRSTGFWHSKARRLRLSVSFSLATFFRFFLVVQPHMVVSNGIVIRWIVLNLFGRNFQSSSLWI